MTKDELFKQIQAALLYGIAIDDNQDSELYLLSICKYINEQTTNRALFEGNKLLIDSSTYSPILSLEVNSSTLYINPLGEDDFFSSFMSVLKYVGKSAQQEEVYDSEFEWI